MMDCAPLIIGIGGSLRDGSTSEKALRFALAEAACLGARTLILTGQSLNLPLYDAGALAPSAEALVEAIRAADGVIIATPSYHGSISGLIKNALDYTEELRTDARPYLTGRAIGSIVCAGGVQAIGATLATLRTIVHALRGWPTPFSAVVNAGQRPFSADGECSNPAIAQQLAFVAHQVAEFAEMRRLHTRKSKASVLNERAESAPALCL